MRKLFFLIPFILLILFSCGTEVDDISTPAPEIPPVTTFLMDFDIITADNGRLAPKSNWSYAALNVGIWNTVIAVTLAIPVASFGEAFNHEPTFDASLPGWVWEYDYNLVNASYHARLEAEVTLSAVEWNMFISKENDYTDFNWYSGTSALDGQSGSWNLNAQPSNPTQFLRIDWNRAISGETADIKYTIMTPNSDQNGDFIYFEKASSLMDRQYDIYKKSNDNTTEIEWSSTTKDGNVIDSEHFGDPEAHCWDEALEDITCS